MGEIKLDPDITEEKRFLKHSKHLPDKVRLRMLLGYRQALLNRVRGWTGRGFSHLDRVDLLDYVDRMLRQLGH